MFFLLTNLNWIGLISGLSLTTLLPVHHDICLALFTRLSQPSIFHNSTKEIVIHIRSLGTVVQFLGFIANLIPILSLLNDLITHAIVGSHK